MKTYILIICQLFIIAICHGQKSNKLSKYIIPIGTQSSRGTFEPLVDLKEGKTYAIDEVVDNQTDIDLVYGFEPFSGASLLVPFSSDLKYYGDSYKIEIGDNWDVKNRGNFILIKYDDGAKNIYRRLKKSKDLEKIYLQKLSEVTSKSDDAINKLGTIRRISGLSVGDLILFHSQDRAFYAAGIVRSVQLGDGGSIHIAFKVAP